MGTFRIEHIYDHLPPRPGDYRVLVDRLWPRGVSKERADLNEWLKDIAPSTQARKEFNHQADKFAQFTQVYRHELETEPQARAAVAHLEHEASDHNVVLLYAAHDPEINHAVVLQQYLEEHAPASEHATSSNDADTLNSTNTNTPDQEES